MLFNSPIQYNTPIFRPPSEAQSILIQVTIGCSNNMCTYCDMYRSKKYRVREISEIKDEIINLKNYFEQAGITPRRFFLCDGDALGAPFNILKETLLQLNASFPGLERVGIYATAQNMLDRSPEELKTLVQLKCSIAYLGLESGADEVLHRIVKRNTQADMIEGSLKLIQSGFKLSVIAMLGIGGRELSGKHVKETINVISKISPHYFSFLTTMAIEGTPYFRQVTKGTIQELTAKEMFVEMRDILNGIKPNRDIIFRANHVSNQYPLGGILPQDQERLINTLDQWIEQTPEGVYPPKPSTM